jgi:hypothetical protein
MDQLRPPVVNPTASDDMRDDEDVDGDLTERERRLPEHEIDPDREQSIGDGAMGGTAPERPSGSGTAAGTDADDENGNPLVSDELDRDEVMPPASSQE